MNNALEIVEAGSKTIVKQLVSYLPLGSVAIGILEELQSKQIERKIQRLEGLYEDLVKSIDSVKSEINEEYVSKDDFLDVFEEVTQYVVQERLDYKRHLFNNIFANSIVSPVCDYDRTERFFRILDNLTEVELQILAILDNPVLYNQKHGMLIDDLTTSDWMQVSAKEVLCKLTHLKDYDATESMTVLFSHGLVIEKALDKQLATNGSILNVLEDLLTKRGKEFVCFIRDVEE